MTILFGPSTDVVLNKDTILFLTLICWELMPLTFVRFTNNIVNIEHLFITCNYMMVNNDLLGVPYPDMNGKNVILDYSV